MTMKVTAEEVKASIILQQKFWIPNHACSLCQEEVGWEIIDGEPYFNSNCDCTRFRSQLRPDTWQTVADHINMQSDTYRAVLIEKLGIRPLLSNEESIDV